MQLDTLIWFRNAPSGKLGNDQRAMNLQNGHEGDSLIIFYVVSNFQNSLVFSDLNPLALTIWSENQLKRNWNDFFH